MAHWKAGRTLPAAVVGSEREVLVREFLSEVFPTPFRFGTGAVVDGSGASSGQVDIVVEFPFLPSFPAPGTPDRLYLVDSVALVIEVKSDIAKQWDQVRKTTAGVKRLRRVWHGHEAVGPTGAKESVASSLSRPPVLAVGYCGPSDESELRRRLAETPDIDRPDGVLVIDSCAYSGCELNPRSVAARGTAGLLSFAYDVAWLAWNVQWAAPDVSTYLGRLGS
jgi:hypothetical protein